MDKRNFDELNAALDACIEAGKIYNVDFKEWTSYGANRMLDAAIKAIHEEYVYCGKFENLTDEELALDDAMGLGPSITQFPSKKLMKALEPMTYTGFAKAVADMVAKFQPMADKFRTLKPMIVKGKKPSDTPRKTKERTLENTGTCSCCGQNVKLSNTGKIVAHGYTIRWGFQSGSCFGVGYDPIEVSDEGVVAYLEALLARHTTVTENKTKMIAERPALTRTEGYGRNKSYIKVNDGEENYDRLLTVQEHNMESELRQIENAITYYTNVRDNWEAQPLPGDLLKEAA